MDRLDKIIEEHTDMGRTAYELLLVADFCPGDFIQGKLKHYNCGKEVAAENCGPCWKAVLSEEVPDNFRG